MRHVLLLASLLAVAALAAVEAPLSATAPSETLAAEIATQPETPAPPAETPAPPPEAPAPAETPAPPAPLATPKVVAPAEVPVPLPVPPPAADFISPRQGIYGPLIPVVPAHQIAILESELQLPDDHPLVVRAAFLLSELTARYVEDAPRIVELTVRVTRAIRARNAEASPIAMLEAAEKWKRPAATSGAVPRRFEHFAARYRKLRVDEGKDHDAALDEIQGVSKPAPAAKGR